MTGTSTAILVTIGVVVVVGVIGAVFVQDAFIVNVLGFCGLVTVSLLSLLQQAGTSKKLEVVAEKAEVAATKVEEVKTTLVKTDEKTDRKLEAIAETVESTHQDVNSGMTLQLRLNKMTTQSLADVRGTPEDIAVAKLAAQQLEEHEKRNALVLEKNKAAKTEAKPASVKDVEHILDAIKEVPKVEVTNLPPVQQVEIVERK